MDREGAIRVMLESPSIIRRPLLDRGATRHIGFSESRVRGNVPLMSPTLELACDLIRRPSLTPDDQGCQHLMAERLAALGFTIEPMPFGEVTNLWARRGDDRTAPLPGRAHRRGARPVRWTSGIQIPSIQASATGCSMVAERPT